MKSLLNGHFSEREEAWDAVDEKADQYDRDISEDHLGGGFLFLNFNSRSSLFLH